jgi:hypothetical protein
MLTTLVALALLAPPLDFERLPDNAKAPVPNYYHRELMMQPVCTDASIEALSSVTRRIVGKREYERAWPVALTVFCGTSRESKRFLMQNAPKKISFEAFPSVFDDGSTVRLRDSKDVLMLNGQAWDALVVGNRENIQYSYNLGGVCGGSFRLRRVDGHWLFVGFSESCD